MIYISPDRSACIVHCSCGDAGKHGPSLHLVYWQWPSGPPELCVYAQEGSDQRTIWRRVVEAMRVFFGKEPRWPDSLCLLGANERDTEVGCVRALAAWLNEKADQYEHDLETLKETSA